MTTSGVSRSAVSWRVKAWAARRMLSGTAARAGTPRAPSNTRGATPAAGLCAATIRALIAPASLPRPRSLLNHAHARSRQWLGAVPAAGVSDGVSEPPAGPKVRVRCIRWRGPSGMLTLGNSPRTPGARPSRQSRQACRSRGRSGPRSCARARNPTQKLPGDLDGGRAGLAQVDREGIGRRVHGDGRDGQARRQVCLERRHDGAGGRARSMPGVTVTLLAPAAMVAMCRRSCQPDPADRPQGRARPWGR